MFLRSTLLTSTASKLLATGLGLLALTSGLHAETVVRSSTYEYEASTGLLSKIVSEPDFVNDCLQQSFQYDVFGNSVAVTKSACTGATGYAISSASTPRVSSSTYNSDGRFPLTSSNALSQSESRVFDPTTGTLTSLTGPNGLTTSWLYDSLNRKTRETRADGTYTTWTYRLCSEAGASCPAPIAGAAAVWVLTEQSYAANAAVNAPQSRSYFDSLGRVIRTQTQGFDGSVAAPTLVSDTEYNARGLVARQSNPYVLGGTPVWTSFTYDVLGRVTQQDQPDPDASGGVATTTNAYYALRVLTTNSKGQSKQTFKNSQGQVTQVNDQNQSSIVYTYDALGQLIQTNAAGSITKIGYNRRGQKASMLDPAMGAWDYRYNAFGELVSQTDSLGQTVTLTYDVLGRMTKRSEPDLISDWSYDKRFDGTACGAGVGKLCAAKSDNGYVRQHSYDTLGRVISTSTVLDNPLAPAVVSETYDANTARVTSKTYPSGYQTQYEYSPLGYLKKVNAGGTNGITQTVSYEILAINARGQTTQYRQGNQITTVKNFDATSGRLASQTATKDGQASGNVLNQTFTYDSLSNVTSRADINLATQESFTYDALNRLSLASIVGGAVNPPTTTQVMYDARGNITYKSDVGRYAYDAQRPNRMTNVTLETAPGAQVTLTGTRALSYAFDDYRPSARSVNGVTVGNGNLEYTVTYDTVNNVHTVRGETYTSFNMPAQIQYGNFITSTTSTSDRTLSFVYGPEHQRIKQQVSLTGNGTSSYFAGANWYLNGEDSLGLTYEKEIRTNGTIEEKHYVSAAGQVFAMFTKRSGVLNGLTATSTNYLHQDHLGSVSVVTDETGAVVERMAYDPWGKRRLLTGLADKLDAVVGQRLDRGYTMHEHLDEVGVIHMNGRVYDPLIGRFMSADPYVQAPTNLKTFNRYAYVWNNPLKNYDPEGFLMATAGDSGSCGGGGGYDFFDGGGGACSGGGGGGGGGIVEAISGAWNAFKDWVTGGSSDAGAQLPSNTPTSYNLALPDGRQEPVIVTGSAAATQPNVYTCYGESCRAALGSAGAVLGGTIAAIGVGTCTTTTLGACIVAAVPAVTGGIATGSRTGNLLGAVLDAVLSSVNDASDKKPANDAAAGAGTVPPEVIDKIPAEWGDGDDNRKGKGTRWQDPNNKGSGVRVDKGDPNNSQPSQQVDHVIVRDKGVVIGRDGNPINGSIKQDPTNAHIPLSEYVNWSSWNKP